MSVKKTPFYFIWFFLLQSGDYFYLYDIISQNYITIIPLPKHKGSNNEYKTESYTYSIGIVSNIFHIDDNYCFA